MNHFEDGKVDVAPSSTGNPPEVLDLGGGIMDGSMVKTEHTDPFPWEWFPDHMLYWTVEFSNDTEMNYYFFESTYGSLDGLNGTFTPLFAPFETSVVYEPEFILWEGSNPDNLDDFGHNVTCWVVDDEGAQSEHFTKLFKYHNGTVELPPEELGIEVTAYEGIINRDDYARLDYEISDPYGSRNYSIGVECDQVLPEDTYIMNTTEYVILNPYFNAPWIRKVVYNFTLVLKVWDGAVLNATVDDSATIYINAPPENGTVYCDIPDRATAYRGQLYNITFTGWVDDLDSHFIYHLRFWSGDNPNTLEYSPEFGNFSLTLNDLYDVRTWELELRIEDTNGEYVIPLSIMFDVVTIDTPDPTPTVPAGTIGLILGPICVISALMFVVKKKIAMR